MANILKCTFASLAIETFTMQRTSCKSKMHPYCLIYKHLSVDL